jgi:hypothetical protein
MTLTSPQQQDDDEGSMSVSGAEFVADTGSAVGAAVYRCETIVTAVAAVSDIQYLVQVTTGIRMFHRTVIFAKSTTIDY